MSLESVGGLGNTENFPAPYAELEKTRRLKIVRVSNLFLPYLLRNGADDRFVKITGLPADAVVVAVSIHMLFDQDLIAIKMYSSEFPVITEGGTIPCLDLTCEEYRSRQIRGREFI